MRCFMTVEAFFVTDESLRDFLEKRLLESDS